MVADLCWKSWRQSSDGMGSNNFLTFASHFSTNAYFSAPMPFL